MPKNTDTNKQPQEKLYLCLYSRKADRWVERRYKIINGRAEGLNQLNVAVKF